MVKTRIETLLFFICNNAEMDLETEIKIEQSLRLFNQTTNTVGRIIFFTPSKIAIQIL
jgi:hypothetical protein